MTPEELAAIQAAVAAVDVVLVFTSKGSRLYNQNPRRVADVNRTGKRFRSALTAVMHQV